MKRRSFKLISVAAVFLIAMFVLMRTALAESYTYTTIDDPDGVGNTFAYGINDGGDIVGFYTDSNGAYHGFLYSGGTSGTYTPLDDSSAGTGQGQGTRSFGINNNGDIVGYYAGSSSANGFRYSGGAYTTIYGPNGASAMLAYGINDGGDIVGIDAPSGGPIDGFLDSNNTFTILDYPNATSTFATGINDYGDIVGFYIDSGGLYHGFRYSGGAYTRLDDPSGGGGTCATGINDSGDIVGYYTDSNGAYHGFLYSGNTYTYTRIEDPSAGTGKNQGTEPFKINDNGDIVGTYLDSSGGYHGFQATPPSLWQNAKELGSGWKWLSWFGYFYTNSSPWIYHMQLGWLYAFGTSTDNIWFYDSAMNAFLWTSAAVYPYVYRASDGAWLYYDVGTSNPQWFYNYKTGQWEKD